MRWLMNLIIFAGLGWSGYWFVGAQAQERLLANWLESSRANGWVAQTDEMNVTGFPNRFDTIITGLDLQGPNGDWGWKSEGFQVYALSYKPNHIILAWPGEQVISNEHGSLTMQGIQMRGSIEVAPNPELTLQRLIIEATDFNIKSSDGWEGTAQSANMALFQDEDISTRYRLGIELKDVNIPQEYMAAVVQVGQNTSLISNVLANAYVDFDQEINRGTLESGLPQWSNIEIEQVSLDWGRANLTVSGELRPGANGFIEGNIDFHVENWKILFAAFEQISQLKPSEMTLVEAALNGAAQGNLLEFSLRFEGGKTLIGPFSIGPALINPQY